VTMSAEESSWWRCRRCNLVRVVSAVFTEAITGTLHSVYCCKREGFSGNYGAGSRCLVLPATANATITAVRQRANYISTLLFVVWKRNLHS